MSNSFLVSEARYFKAKLEPISCNYPCPFNFLDKGTAYEVKIPDCSLELGYRSVWLPQPGSEWARFRCLIWQGTGECVINIIEKKTKKLKFEQPEVRDRILAALDYIIICFSQDEQESGNDNVGNDSDNETFWDHWRQGRIA